MPSSRYSTATESGNELVVNKLDGDLEGSLNSDFVKLSFSV